MTHLLMNGPHHTVAALDVLALVLIPVIVLAARYFVRHRDMFYAPQPPAAGQPAPALDIHEAQLVRTPITDARKAIEG